MLDNYVSIIDQIKEEVLSFEDWDDDLVYNKKINIPVCVISLSSIIKKGYTYYPQV